MQSLNENIPDPSIRRLSAYLRQLEYLAADGVQRVSSRQLARFMKVGPAMVRRDLALFGQFGRRGVGYDVPDLIHAIRVILGTHRQWQVVAVGAGRLCEALLRYGGFSMRGFDLVCAFDTNPKRVGKKIGDIEVRNLDDLEAVLAWSEARLAILTLPVEAAQEATDRLVAAGIEGILNFAAPKLDTPPSVHVTNVDITAHLEELSFHVSSSRP